MLEATTRRIAGQQCKVDIIEYRIPWVKKFDLVSRVNFHWITFIDALLMGLASPFF